MSANWQKRQSSAWIDAHISFTGDDCLIWPFYRDRVGKGRITINREVQFAHREMCRRAHGEPPSNEHHAAHNCGKAHLGCVHPQHLAWKTAKENCADKIVHGTLLRGQRHPSTKVPSQGIDEIVAANLSIDGTTARLAAAYGISYSSVKRIHQDGAKP